jgi:hypothetical protein
MAEIPPRKPRQRDLLVIIDELARRNANVTLEDLRDHYAFRLGWLAQPSREELRGLLASMISADLVLRDGSGHTGERFSLTYEGKEDAKDLRDPPWYKR